MPVPFSHDDLELKRHLLNLAREYKGKQDSLEHELAGALLYMNVADYLAEYLVVGITELSRRAVSQYYFGVISMQADQRQRDGFNIGQSIYYLKQYDFPRKTDIINELEAVNANRKKIAHEMFKVGSQRLNEIDQAVHELEVHTEALVDLVDEISPGMPPMDLRTKIAQLDLEGEIEASTEKKKGKKKQTASKDDD